MMRDSKEQRLKDLNRRFRSIGARHDFIVKLRRHARDPKAWVLCFLCLAALVAVLAGLS